MRSSSGRFTFHYNPKLQSVFDIIVIGTFLYKLTHVLVKSSVTFDPLIVQNSCMTKLQSMERGKMFYTILFCAVAPLFNGDF